MANNRLWLVHRPSKTRLCLGKRMGTGWYAAPDPKRLEAFYDWIESEHFGTMDDFKLLIEINERVTQSAVLQDKWTYDDYPLFRGQQNTKEN